MASLVSIMHHVSFFSLAGGVLFKVKNRLWLRMVTAVWGSLTETVTGGHDVGSWAVAPWGVAVALAVAEVTVGSWLAVGHQVSTRHWPPSPVANSSVGIFLSAGRPSV